MMICFRCLTLGNYSRDPSDVIQELFAKIQKEHADSKKDRLKLIQPVIYKKCKVSISTGLVVPNAKKSKKAKRKENLDRKLQTPANTDLLSESEDMQQDYFEEISTDGATGSISEPNIAVSEASPLEMKLKDVSISKIISEPPKLIMAHEIMDVTNFTYRLENECNTDFLVEISGRWINLQTKTFAMKNKIVEYLKEKNF